MTEPTAIAQVLEIPLTRVHPDEHQPRRYFDADRLAPLAADIRLRGVEQPIIVVRHPDKDGHYRIKVGERRYRASKLARRKTIPAIVTEAGEALDTAFHQVQENLLRQDLNPIEWAHFFRRLRDEFQLPIKDIVGACEARGLKNYGRAHVSNTIRLCELPAWAQAMIAAGELTAAHGKHLLVATACDEVMAAMCNRLRQDNSLSTQQLQQAIYREFYARYPIVDGGGYLAESPLFDIEPHRKALNLRRISAGWGEGAMFALNRELYDRLQAEARAARQQGQQPGPNHQGEGQDTAAGLQCNPERLRHYFRQLLIRTLTVKLCADHDTRLAAVIILWKAFGRPGNCHYGYVTQPMGDRQPLDKAREAAGCTGLISICQQFMEGERERLERTTIGAACGIIGTMGLATLCQFAAHIGWTPAENYQVDGDYLDLHRKRALLTLAVRSGLDEDPDWRGQKKVNDMRLWLSTQRSRVRLPEDIAELWQDMLHEAERAAPYIGDKYEEHDLRPICVGCGADDEDVAGTDAGRCWLAVDAERESGVCSHCRDHLAAWLEEHPQATTEEQEHETETEDAGA